MKPRKRRLKYITVLPAFVTLMNGACGFISIFFASLNRELRWSLFFRAGFDVSSFTLSGYMIILAMIADMLDGRLARLTRTTSSFGGQLDSLTDVISFGVAPAFLMLKLVETYLDSMEFENLRFSLLIERSIFFSAILYAMCAVVRLARFNVENEEDEAAHMNFAGLPSPAAAGVVVSFVVLHEHFWGGIGDVPVYANLGIITVSVLPLITFLVSLLMVSRIRYPHLTNQLLRGKKTLAALLTIFACGLLIVWNIHIAMVFGFCGYVLFGLFRWVIVSLIKKLPSKRKAATEDIR
jgi:CDP-diacylglycerol--serine O-phosphatidyltransferase